MYILDNLLVVRYRIVTGIFIHLYTFLLIVQNALRSPEHRAQLSS